MSIQALRVQRTQMAADARKLLDSVKPEEWTDEHNQQYQQIVDSIDKVDAQIERHEKQLEIEASNRQAVQDRSEREGLSLDEAQFRNQQDKDIFMTWMRGGVNALSSEQQQIVLQRAREVRNTMSTGTGSEGGYLVPNEFSRTLLEALKAFGGVREAVTVMPTSTGASMDWPTTDATSEEGELVGENASVSHADPQFGTKSLDTYKFSSKTVAVPFELLQDSQIDLEAHIRGRLQERLGRITNKLFTVGTGTNQPTGLVTASASGKIGATGKTTDVDFDDLIDLEHALDPAYRMGGGVGYMFHDSTLKVLKKKKDSQNRPLWIPGYDIKEPDMINGKPYIINQHMPVMAAGAKSILFGDFSRYIVRDVMQVMLFRMTDSKYTEKGQVGFLAFMRSGGNLMDVGGAVKHYQNSAT